MSSSTKERRESQNPPPFLVRPIALTQNWDTENLTEKDLKKLTQPSPYYVVIMGIKLISTP